MKNARWFHTGGAVCALIVLCLSAALVGGAVTAEPANATFTSPQQSATIQLTNNGAPIPAKDIRGWRFLASGRDYNHMLSVEKMDGALRIAPSKTIEAGSYDLNIETAQGYVVVQIFAPLSGLPGIVEKTMAMGQVAATGREEIPIGLSPAYYHAGERLASSPDAGPAQDFLRTHYNMTVIQ